MNTTTDATGSGIRRVRPADELGAAHFIGIGGAGMSGIARVLLARGMRVTGSDARDSSVVTALRAQGATITVGHRAEAVDGADTVVISSAIRADNPELVRARELGLPIIHRSEALAGLMVGRRGVAIAGTHGKTTTTSMTTVALQACGADPSFVIGGVLTASGTNAHEGTGDVFIAEADESDGSFLLYSPVVSVLTNVEADHLDYYGTPERVREAFEEFAARLLETSGTLVACLDDPGAREIAAHAAAQGIRVSGYGRDASRALDAETASFAQIVPESANAAEQRFDLRMGEETVPVLIRQPGAYNAANAAAAICTAAALGCDPARAAAGLAEFRGTRRRFEYKGAGSRVRVYDDYAHHPTELRALLTAARDVVDPGCRVHVVFQPHLFSRTLNFKTEFGEALGLADDVVVLDVFPAREDPIPGVTGAIVAAEVPHDEVIFIPALSEAVDHLLERVGPGDIVITAGAGDVTLLGPEIVAALDAR